MSSNGVAECLMKGADQNTGEWQGVVSVQVSKLFNIQHFSPVHCSGEAQTSREIFAKSCVFISICLSNPSFKLKLMMPKEYKWPSLFILPFCDHQALYTECTVLLNLVASVNISLWDLRYKVVQLLSVLSPKLVINKWFTVQFDAYSVSEESTIQQYPETQHPKQMCLLLHWVCILFLLQLNAKSCN